MTAFCVCVAAAQMVWPQLWCSPARGHGATAWVISLKAERREPPQSPVTQGLSCPLESHSADHRPSSLSVFSRMPKSTCLAQVSLQASQARPLRTVSVVSKISQVCLSRRHPDGGRVCGEAQPSPRSPQSCCSAGTGLSLRTVTGPWSRE